ncbi:MAG: hypothetical protein ACOYB3_00715 [Azonexus sp.]
MNIDAPIPAIPNVAPAASAQAVIAPQPADRWQALRQIGWWKPVDNIILAVLAAHLVTGFFFLVFGKLSFDVAVIGFLQMVIFLLAWCVILAYRCMDFVVQLRANIEMLPFDSARIAVGFLQGGQPLSTPVQR